MNITTTGGNISEWEWHFWAKYNVSLCASVASLTS